MNNIGFSKDIRDAAWELFRVDVNSIKGQGSAQTRADRKVHVLLKDLEGMVNQIPPDRIEMTGVTPQVLIKFASDLKPYARGDNAKKLQAITARLVDLLFPKKQDEAKPTNIMALERKEGDQNPYAMQVEGLSQWMGKWLEKNAPTLSYEYFLTKCQPRDTETVCNAFQLFRKMEKNPDEISDKALLILATHYINFQQSAGIIKKLPKLRENFCPCSSALFAKNALEVVPGAENKEILGLSDTEEDFCVYFKTKEAIQERVLQTVPALGAMLDEGTLLSGAEMRPYLALINYKVMEDYKEEILRRPLTPGEVAHYWEASRFVAAHKDDPILKQHLKDALVDNDDPFTDEIFEKIATSAALLSEDEVGPRLQEGAGTLRYSPSGNKLVITIRDPELSKLRNIKIDRGNMGQYIRYNNNLIVVKKAGRSDDNLLILSFP